MFEIVKFGGSHDAMPLAVGAITVNSRCRCLARIDEE